MDGITIGTIIVQPVQDDVGMRAQGYLSMMWSEWHLKAEYPELWAKIKETQWVDLESDIGFTLRMLHGQFIRGYHILTTEEPGKVQEDAAPAITGAIKIRGTSVNGLGIMTNAEPGALHTGEMEDGPTFQVGSTPINAPKTLWIDASRSSPKYGNTLEVRPTNVAAFYYIKATAGYVPENKTDLEAVLTAQQQIATTLINTQQLELSLAKVEQMLTELQGSDYITQYWRSADGNTWYRKYKSGWVEQGGILASGSASEDRRVTLPVPMATNRYHKMKMSRGGVSSSHGFAWQWVADAQSGTADTQTVAYFAVPGPSFVVGAYWEVKGQAA